MAGKLTENGASKLLGRIITTSTMYLGLYVNDYTPTINDASDLSDYTEASFSGYSRVALSAFGSIVSDPGLAEITHDIVNFTPSSGASGTAYGVLLIDSSDGSLILAVRFATPKTITPGENIPAQLKLRLKDPTVS